MNKVNMDMNIKVASTIIMAVARRVRLVNCVGHRINQRGLDCERKAALFDFVRFVVVHRIDGRVNRDVRACAVPFLQAEGAFGNQWRRVDFCGGNRSRSGRRLELRITP